MTYDLLVVTRLEPTRTTVEACLRDIGWKLSLSGELGGAGDNLLAEERGLLRRRPVFSLDGPLPADRLDLPAAMRRVVKEPHFQVGLNMPWSAVESFGARAIRFCEALARVCDGAVYDPQDDRVLYPEQPPKPPRPAPAYRHIRLLELDWVMADPGPRDAAEALLAAMEATWPEALPRKFGPVEPLRFKLAAPGGRQQFAQVWSETAAERPPDLRSFHWSSARPFFAGMAGWDTYTPAHALPSLRVHASLNASAIADDPQACDRAVQLFGTVASALGAFFGGARVLRHYLLGTRGQWNMGPESEQALEQWLWGPGWIGIPPGPSWLRWYGDPYRDLVADSLGPTGEAHPRGLLVRLGPTPLDADQLDGLMPALPLELVFEALPDQPAGRPVVRVPARHIPEVAP
jgi:hypothetical protein